MQTFFGGPFRRGTPNRRDEKRRAVLRAEMGACFFQLNGLERDDVEYVMNTFPIVERRDTNRFGEYPRRVRFSTRSLRRRKRRQLSLERRTSAYWNHSRSLPVKAGAKLEMALTWS